jgi:RNA polymerase sigma factor for flagellar operon FliA
MPPGGVRPVPVKTQNIAPKGQELQQCLKRAARKAYQDHHKQPLQNERVLKYLPMVAAVAERVTSYLKPPLAFEDLVSAGTIALIKAVRDYDPSRAAEFKTYAYIRIKGAVIDELRAWSFVPAGVVKQFRRMQAVFQRIIDETGAVPSDPEFAAALQISVDELYKMLELGRSQHFLSIHGGGEDSPALGKTLVDAGVIDPGRWLERAELLEYLAEAIRQLPAKQRRIIVLYYNQGLTMKQIAEVLEITESRVSQLHASALFKLSVKLRKWDESGE